MSVILDLTGNDLKAGDTGSIMPALLHYSFPLTAASVSQISFLNTSTTAVYQVSAVSTTFSTASASGTIQVEVVNGTTVLGSGTNQLTGTISTAGTINTPVAGTLIAAPTNINGGGRVNLILAGTATGLVGNVMILIKRIV